jgi:hypothetical protein
VSEGTTHLDQNFYCSCSSSRLQVTAERQSGLCALPSIERESEYQAYTKSKPNQTQTRPDQTRLIGSPNQNQNQTKPDQTKPNQAGSHALQFPKGMQHPLRVALGRRSITSTRTHPKLTRTHRDDTNPTHGTLQNPRVLEIMHVRGQSRSESRYSGRGRP